MSGGAGFQPDAAHQQLINDLRNGNTTGQLARERARRAAIAIISGVGNAVGSSMAAEERQSENAKRRQMSKAIENQTKQSREWDKYRSEAARLGPPDNGTYSQAPETPKQDPSHPIPGWLTDYSGGSDSKSAAQGALSNQSANASAQAAPVGGYRTTDGINSAYDTSTAMANDTGTGMDIIRDNPYGDGGGTGMMGSIEPEDPYR